MTFEDRIDGLLENGFYLHRACNHLGPNKFHIIIGKKARLYVGEGNTLSEALTEAVDNYEKGETWPPAWLRHEVFNGYEEHAGGYKELDDTLKDLGIDLN